MINTELVGWVSFAVTSCSAIPYLRRVWKRKSRPSLLSFVLWTVISLVMLLSYDGAGATDSLPVVLVAFTNSLAGAIVIAIRRKRDEASDDDPKTIFNALAVIFCVLSLGVYLWAHGNKELAVVALWASVIADLCAALPTIKIALYEPEHEQPFAWSIYLVGEIIGCFSITENTVAQWLPIAYGIALAAVMLPSLVSYRIRLRIPLREWV